MPNLKEAAVAVAGTVMDVEFTTDYETKKRDGNARVVLSTGDGFAQVKLTADDLADAGDLAIGVNVAWMVRFGAWSRNDNAQATCRFVRQINDNDLDRINSFIRVLTPSK